MSSTNFNIICLIFKNVIHKRKIFRNALFKIIKPLGSSLANDNGVLYRWILLVRSICHILYKFSIWPYSKPCLNPSLKNRQNTDLNDNL